MKVNKILSVFLMLMMFLPGCYEPVSEKNTDEFYGIDIDSKDVPMFTLITENGTEFNLSEYEGKVVVIITVDKKGNVISAIPGAKGSTTLNKELLKRAKTAALKTKFNAKSSAPNNQQGKIIYYFNLN